MNRMCFFQLCALLTISATAHAQLPTGWRAHDWNRPAPPIVTPGEAALPVAPPSDAIVLFDGKDLSQWRDNEGNDAKWVIKDGVMESVPGSGYLFTRKAFGDIQLHVEWASPAKVEGKSQGRGNSGVFLMGLFEIQVLDCFDNRTYADGQAGSLYGQYPPLVNVCREPGQWQSYEIIFRRPRFGGDGKLITPARFTVLQNGVLVQDNVTAFGPTSWLQHLPYEPKPDRLPLSLQDHGNPVRYRNIWVRQLDELPLPPPITAYEAHAEELSSEELDLYAGNYGDSNPYKVRRRDRHLVLEVAGRSLEMIARSKTEFGIRYTAATITFELDSEGRPTAMSYDMGGDKRRVERVEK